MLGGTEKIPTIPIEIIGDALEQQQQRCLRSVTGGFRATSRKQLESEAAVPPLRAHMARLQLQARVRMEASGVRTEIQEACERLKRQLARRPGRRRRAYISPGQARHRWAESILWPQRPLESTKGSLGLPPWADSRSADTPPLGTPPHEQSCRPACYRSNGAGRDGTSSTVGPHLKSSCWTQILEGETTGSRTGCRTGRLSGFAPAYPRPKAAS